MIGAGPAGATAATRAAELGARTTLVTRDRFGGMAAQDGPVPVRTLAHAARLIRRRASSNRTESPRVRRVLDYAKLLERVRGVVDAVREHSSLREQADRAGVTILENAGRVCFTDPHTVVSESGARLEADRFILCTGGRSRRLTVPGSELTVSHSEAWSLTEVPPSILVIGGGMTGLQVASIFRAFGTRVELFQSGPRILPAEDEDTSAEVAKGLRAAGIVVREAFGAIESFERTAGGVRMLVSKDGVRETAEAALAVVTVGWIADTEGMNLDAAGIEPDAKGFPKVDEFLRTTASHVYAAGDITGRFMVVPPAVHDGYVAATNAVLGATMTREAGPIPVAGFTDPEYGSIRLTEADARKRHDAVSATIRFEETTRTIIDGRTTGFCKLVADRDTRRILGCHVVGEHAADIVQGIAIAMAGGLRVDQLALLPLPFPTYVGVLSRTAYRVARHIDPNLDGPRDEHLRPGGARPNLN